MLSEPQLQSCGGGRPTGCIPSISPTFFEQIRKASLGLDRCPLRKREGNSNKGLYYVISPCCLKLTNFMNFQQVMQWLNAICEAVNGNASLQFSLQNLLFGYHWQYIPSCVAACIQTSSNLANFQEQKIIVECKHDLMQMLRPDGVAKVMKVVATSRQHATPSLQPASRGVVKSVGHALLAPFVEDYLSSSYYGSLLDFVCKNKHLLSST
jgi:hypothetical protein